MKRQRSRAPLAAGRVLGDFQIVLDVVDTHTNRVVWRGWAQDNIDGVIDRQDLLRKVVNTAVARMMELFPRHL